MTVVEPRVYVRRRYEWVIPASTEIVFIGDLRDAISMAAAKYQEATGDFPQIPNTENWLRVDWTEGALRFWFEVDAVEPAPETRCVACGKAVRASFRMRDDDGNGPFHLACLDGRRKTEEAVSA